MVVHMPCLVGPPFFLSNHTNNNANHSQLSYLPLSTVTIIYWYITGTIIIKIDCIWGTICHSIPWYLSFCMTMIFFDIKPSRNQSYKQSTNNARACRPECCYVHVYVSFHFVDGARHVRYLKELQRSD